jgi:hypothetical protein
MQSARFANYERATIIRYWGQQDVLAVFVLPQFRGNLVVRLIALMLGDLRHSDTARDTSVRKCVYELLG